MKEQEPERFFRRQKNPFFNQFYQILVWEFNLFLINLNLFKSNEFLISLLEPENILFCFCFYMEVCIDCHCTHNHKSLELKNQQLELSSQDKGTVNIESQQNSLKIKNGIF